MTRPSGDVPVAVRHFLYACIDSIEQLDALLCLRAAGKPAAVREVSAKLSCQTETARIALEALVARGLVQVKVAEPSNYRYEPRTAELREYVDALVDFHSRDRSAILTLVAGESRSSIKRFADAFKWRKDPE